MKTGWIKSCMAACLVVVLTSAVGRAGDWAGKYMTEDTKGNAFAITLADDGAATGSKEGHTLTGTWTQEGDAAVIKWTTCWTTKISKDGDSYSKTAFRPGAAMDEGSAASGVEKVE